MPDASASAMTRSRVARPLQTRQQAGYRTSWQLLHGGHSPGALAHLALRTASPVVLDALALGATGGTRTAAQVVEAPDLRIHPAGASHAAALALALAGTGRSLEDLVAATDLYGALWAADTFAGLAPIHHQAFGQALFLADRRARLREALPDLTKLPHGIRHDLDVDLANPHLSGDPAAPAEHERWESLLASRFVEAGLEPVTVRGDAPHLFDRLGSDPAGTAGTGPLVSVIMPCFRPDEGLLTSIASISRQTWGDLEILVVDDASGPDFEEVFARAVASDERARLVRMEHNGGSYLGRNAALEQARGELITFQDADDWSHPRRLEQQAGLLLEERRSPASRSLAVRAKDDLTHQWFGYRSVRDNASSLMLRRSVIDSIGPFAAIRKGADSEYAERVTTLLGPILDTGTPLAITRLRTGTLSRGDFTYQWSTPERLAFKGSYRAWHRRLSGPGAGPYGPQAGPDGSQAALGEPRTGPNGSPAGPGGSQAGPGEPRAVPDAAGPAVTPEGRPGFPVPRSFLRGLPHHPTWDRLPVSYLGDFSGDPTGEARDEGTHDGVARDGTGAGDDPSAALWGELDAGGAQPVAAPPVTGAPQIGLWHLESAAPPRRTRPEMHDAWFDRILDSLGTLVPLTRLEPVRVERLVVLDPRVLLLAGAQEVRLAVRQVDVRLSPALLEPDASGLPVDLLAVGDVIRAAWGTGPRWVLDPSLDDAGRATVRELVPGLLAT